jgi:stearoyl-CoA desaturase (delta-9 desaturase)
MKNISLGLRVGGLLLAHVVPVTLLWTGVTRRDWMAFGLMYVVTMFTIGGGLHRYFAHKSYRTSRAFQLVLGLLASCIFGDPIEFAAKHRWHHRFSDTGSDVHSPFRGFWQCWIGHILQACHTEEEMRQLTPDLGRCPELRWLHRYWFVPGLVTVAMFLAAGGYVLFACAYCLSFLSALHGSSAVAYFCHRGGHRKYETRDYSSNRPVLVALLLEGWHNNHHHYPAAARAGFAWYEFDPLYWMLKALSWLGIVWDLREPPEALRIVRAKPSREAACGLS